MAKISTWGYHATEEAKIFELEPGESLPAGWFDSPANVQQPAPKAKRKAEKVSDGGDDTDGA